MVSCRNVRNNLGRVKVLGRNVKKFLIILICMVMVAICGDRAESAIRTSYGGFRSISRPTYHPNVYRYSVKPVSPIIKPSPTKMIPVEPLSKPKINPTPSVSPPSTFRSWFSGWSNWWFWMWLFHHEDRCDPKLDQKCKN